MIRAGGGKAMELQAWTAANLKSKSVETAARWRELAWTVLSELPARWGKRADKRNNMHDSGRHRCRHAAAAHARRQAEAGDGKVRVPVQWRLVQQRLGLQRRRQRYADTLRRSGLWTDTAASMMTASGGWCRESAGAVRWRLMQQGMWMQMLVGCGRLVQTRAGADEAGAVEAGAVEAGAVEAAEGRGWCR